MKQQNLDVRRAVHFARPSRPLKGAEQPSGLFRGHLGVAKCPERYMCKIRAYFMWGAPHFKRGRGGRLLLLGGAGAREARD